MSDVAIPSQNHAVSNKFFEGQVSQAKTLGSSHAKALGADPALAQWYQEAYAYYQQVNSGAAAMPDQAAWNEFLTQMNWAYEQLHGSSWDGGQWGNGDPWGPEGDDFGASQGNDPYGGMVGPTGNLIHNTATADFGLLGGVTREIWSNEVNVHIPSLSAQVETVLTQDDSVQPAEMVLKIRVTDPATGQTDTYIVHDYEDAKINVFTPTQQQLNDASGLIQWKEFTEGPETNVQEGVSEPVETLEDGSYSVEATGSSPIDFTPPYDPENTETEVWDLYGDFNLNLRPSDKVRVAEGSPKDPDGYTVTITRKNGQVITIHTHGGYQGNINGNERNVTWVSGSNTSGVSTGGRFDAEVLDEAVVATDGYTVAGEEEEEDFSVPAEFADAFTLNGESNEDKEVDLKGDQPTDWEGDKRIYDGQDFNISPVPAGEGKETTVVASGTVTITPNSNREFYEMSYDRDSGYYILKVYTDETKGTLKETIKIDGELVDKIQLNVDPSRYTFEHEMGEAPTVEDKIQVGDEKETGEGEALPGYDQILANLPPYIVNRLEMQEAMALFDAAVQSKDPADWQKFLDHLKHMDPRYANDAIRSLVTALYHVGGDNYVNLKEMLKLIPQNIREGMAEIFSHAEDGITRTDDELNERHDGEIWNSRDTRDLLNSIW